MKKIVALLSLFLTSATVFAQVSLNGLYVYSFKAPADAPASESERGPSGSLVLVQMENDKYRFWLDITKGWPSYAVGETDGTIVFKNDTASFDNTFEDAQTSCILKFRKSGNMISISSEGASFNCGFGNGVVATGDYIKADKQPLFNNEWLKKEYPNAPTFTVTNNNTEIYQDENALRSFPKKIYVSKGDHLLNISETGTTIYTEFFQPSGKFIYGWVRKTALKNEAPK